MKKTGHSLDKIVESAQHLEQVYKKDLQFGDLLLITTRNSSYHIRVLGNGFYQVSGGWFDRNGLSPFKTGIAGCTWGGSIIKTDIIAACGLCLEFANRLTTSAIREYQVIRFDYHD